MECLLAPHNGRGNRAALIRDVHIEQGLLALTRYIPSRLENEHLNNVGMFRAVKMVPFSF
ncbi:Phosphate transporter PHO1-2 [Acorus gramineus]|uniref:Phosphate transporter PHO1-2 n=1 Tax=Acorus gramineus TaxID=55184 RepID=A0AAV9AAP9_ACOGR|nr:Phosphate transporter PHO1-2 [Acorus gramineus]